MADKACVKRLQKEYRALCKGNVSLIRNHCFRIDFLDAIKDGSSGRAFLHGHRSLPSFPSPLLTFSLSKPSLSSRLPADQRRGVELSSSSRPAAVSIEPAFSLLESLFVPRVSPADQRRRRVLSFSLSKSLYARRVSAVDQRWRSRRRLRNLLGHQRRHRSRSTSRSVFAFAPVYNPVKCPWGQKAFSNYLGSNKSDWEEYDATCLVGKVHKVSTSIPIDQIQGAVFDLPEDIAKELLTKQMPPGNTISKITKI